MGKELVSNLFQRAICFWVFIVMSGCLGCDSISVLSGVGTHGAIVSYTYGISKNSLESAIDEMVIGDSRFKKLKNDRTHYTDLLITGDVKIIFVFRYSGDESYWKSHPNESHISIAYIKREGEDVYRREDELSKKEKKEIIKVFEENFIKVLREQKGLDPKQVDI